MRSLLLAPLLALACGGTSHQIELVPPSPNSDPIAALFGSEKDAGIERFYSLTDMSGKTVAADDLAPGAYKLQVRPPCGKTSERTVEVRKDQEIKFEIPAVEPQTLYANRRITAPEVRYAGNQKTLEIEPDSEVEMVRPWPLKKAGPEFSAGKDCIGALIRVVDPLSPAGELYIVPRSALRDTPTDTRPKEDPSDTGTEEQPEQGGEFEDEG
ncbi:MAG: hypothetical protein KJO07_06755 [Deltaproteobacteria bacterium]|nr:hypothetical protein [Deltaproteobacteria bacterium]